MLVISLCRFILFVFCFDSLIIHKLHKLKHAKNIKMKLFISVLVVCTALVNCRQVCYTEADYDYGCFTDEAPFGGTFQRPLAFLPDKPSRIASRFTLYNKANPKGTVVNFQTASDFIDPKVQTKLIIHGFLHHDNHVWVQSMKSNHIFRSRKAKLRKLNKTIFY